MDINGWLVAFGWLGTVLGVLLLLNLRDRREAALGQTMWRLAPRDLVPLISIEIRCALLWPTSVARVDMWGARWDEVRRALARWREGLPCGVRLHVNG